MKTLRILPALILLALASGVAAGSPIASAPAASDPQLLFSTFIGGINWDEGKGIARDASGNVYIAGQTLSTFFPTAPGGGESAQHAVESFIARLNWNGTALDYINVYTADVEDWGETIAVDAAGNAYMAGRTDSTDYPTTPGAYDTTPNGNFDVFLMKFDPAGQLVFSTLLGGGEDEWVNGIRVDAAGDIYLAGATSSDGSSSAVFPTTLDAYEGVHNGGRDAFLAKFSPDGAALEYSTFLGGTGNDHAEALDLRAGVVVLAGWTTSADFDTPAGGYDTVKDGAFDAFVAALTPGSDSLEYWTYLGGTDGASVTGERALAIDLDGAGRVFLAGSTVAADFPATPGAFDTTFGGGSCSGFPCSDAFAALLSSNGKSLLWATFLGGDDDDSAESLQLDSQGDVVLAGRTFSPAFPVTVDAFDGVFDGPSDAFVLRLTGAGDEAAYATFLGGGTDEIANDVWVSPEGWVYLTGWSDSPDFPTTPGSYDPNLNAFQDVFVTVLMPPGSPGLEGLFLPLIMDQP